MDLKITLDSLTEALKGILSEYIAGATADLQADLQGDVARIATRTAELGFRALSGDKVALDTLDDMKAQAISVAVIVEIREQARVVNALRAAAAVAVKVLLSLAAAAA